MESERKEKVMKKVFDKSTSRTLLCTLNHFSKGAIHSEAFLELLVTHCKRLLERCYTL